MLDHRQSVNQLYNKRKIAQFRNPSTSDDDDRFLDLVDLKFVDTLAPRLATRERAFYALRRLS